MFKIIFALFCVATPFIGYALDAPKDAETSTTLSDALLLDKLTQFENAISDLQRESSSLKEELLSAKQAYRLQGQKLDFMSSHMENTVSAADRVVSHSSQLVAWGSFITFLLLGFATLIFQWWSGEKRKADIEKVGNEIGEELVRGVLHNGGVKEKFLDGLFGSAKFISALNKAVERIKSSDQAERDWQDGDAGEQIVKRDQSKKGGTK